MFNYEEKAKREHKVMADLQRLVQRHIGQDVGPTHDPFAAKASDGADAWSLMLMYVLLLFFASFFLLLVTFVLFYGFYRLGE